MTFKDLNEAFVWIWLPGHINPVVAGKMTRDDDQFVFNYGQSYLKRKNKISIYIKELPLKPGIINPPIGLSLASCLRDSSPDAWGRKVIINRKFGRKGRNIDTNHLDELTYLLESGSDRIGFLDFQISSTQYIPRINKQASLDELIQSAKKVEDGTPLSEDLDQALNHGTSIGGARPKALIEEYDKKYIAKFSSSSDVYNVIKAEFIAMRLAEKVGIRVAPVRLTRSSGKDVLLVERFDRYKTDKGWCRLGLISGLTLLGLNELQARYASYENLAHFIRINFKNPKEELRELFKRLIFNIITGNTDDHARNHAAIWDGDQFLLSPAYDICPQSRSGNIASQGMIIFQQKNMSQLSICIEACHQFLLDSSETVVIIEKTLKDLLNSWESVCKEANLSEVDRNLFSQRFFLNSFIFEGLPRDANHLEEYREKFLKLNN